MGNLEDEIRGLLMPTYDEKAWYREVTALDKERAIPVLVEILEDGGEQGPSRRQSALILGILGDRQGVEPLLRALRESPDRLLRGYAADALGMIGGQEVVSGLIGALKDEDPFVRQMAAKALGKVKSPESLVALEEMVAKDDVSINRDEGQDAIRSIRGAG